MLDAPIEFSVEYSNTKIFDSCSPSYRVYYYPLKRCTQETPTVHISQNMIFVVLTHFSLSQWCQNNQSSIFYCTFAYELEFCSSDIHSHSHPRTTLAVFTLHSNQIPLNLFLGLTVHSLSWSNRIWPFSVWTTLLTHLTGCCSNNIGTKVPHVYCLVSYKLRRLQFTLNPRCVEDCSNEHICFETWPRYTTSASRPWCNDVGQRRI